MNPSPGLFHHYSLLCVLRPCVTSSYRHRSIRSCPGCDVLNRRGSTILNCNNCHHPAPVFLPPPPPPLPGAATTSAGTGLTFGPPWVCVHCTFENTEDGSLHCKTCEISRLAPPPMFDMTQDLPWASPLGVQTPHGQAHGEGTEFDTDDERRQGTGKNLTGTGSLGADTAAKPLVRLSSAPLEGRRLYGVLLSRTKTSGAPPAPEEAFQVGPGIFRASSVPTTTYEKDSVIRAHTGLLAPHLRPVKK